MTGKEVMKRANALRDKAGQDRRFLHQNAEVGFDLAKTKKYVWQRLTEMGFQPKECGKAGIVACVGTARKGKKAFLLRADMDALPMQEKTGAPFACKTGAMHACGHDLHTAILLCAGGILKAFEKELDGEVKLLFQPAEEILQGARNTIENGCLENPNVGGALALHVLTGVPLEVGQVVVPDDGVSAPSADYFKIEVRGKSCHASAPQNGVDATVIAGHILSGLQTVIAREISANIPAVLTVGKMSSGSAGNAISDYAELSGTLRAFDEEMREFMKKRVAEVSSGIARAFRGKAKTVFEGGCPSLLNDKEICRITALACKELLGAKGVISSADLAGGAVQKRSGGSEDFAYISRAVPSCMPSICAGNSKDGFTYPLHHPKTAFDERALPIGAGVLAFTAIKWLER